jgi:hypothetical protein
MNTEQKNKVAKLIDIYTGGHPRQMFWLLSGNAKASVRAHIMSEINGYKTPQSKSGITAIFKALIEMFEVNTEGTCLAEDEDNLKDAMGFTA